MMTPEAAFLADIAEDPEDDTPRRIFADWLSDHGDPRGELLRVQCELARLPADVPPPLELLAREQALLMEHGADWQGGPPTGVGIWFERGLLQVTTSVHLLATPRMRTWWAGRQGWVLGLRLYDCDSAALERFVAEGLLAELAQLDLGH